MAVGGGEEKGTVEGLVVFQGVVLGAEEVPGGLAEVHQTEPGRRVQTDQGVLRLDVQVQEPLGMQDAYLADQLSPDHQDGLET